MKRHICAAITGAISTGALPPSVGCFDWRIIAGAAAAGAIGGVCGVNVAKIVKRQWLAMKGKQPQE